MSEYYMFFSATKPEQELGYTHRAAAEAPRDAWDWFCDNDYVTDKHGKSHYACV